MDPTIRVVWIIGLYYDPRNPMILSLWIIVHHAPAPPQPVCSASPCELAGASRSKLYSAPRASAKTPSRGSSAEDLATLQGPAAAAHQGRFGPHLHPRLLRARGGSLLEGANDEASSSRGPSAPMGLPGPIQKGNEERGGSAKERVKAASTPNTSNVGSRKVREETSRRRQRYWVLICYGWQRRLCSFDGSQLKVRPWLSRSRAVFLAAGKSLGRLRARATRGLVVGSPHRRQKMVGWYVWLLERGFSLTIFSISVF